MDKWRTYRLVLLKYIFHVMVLVLNDNYVIISDRKWICCSPLTTCQLCFS